MPRVLIVDDHPTFRQSARQMLEAEGYEIVAEAADAAEAVRVAGDLHPDVVLLDIHLPDRDGFEVAAELGQAPEAPAVVLISSREGAWFDDLAARSGARGFVRKDELSAATVTKLLS